MLQQQISPPDDQNCPVTFQISLLKPRHSLYHVVSAGIELISFCTFMNCIGYFGVHLCVALPLVDFGFSPFEAKQLVCIMTAIETDITCTTINGCSEAAVLATPSAYRTRWIVT